MKPSQSHHFPALSPFVVCYRMWPLVPGSKVEFKEDSPVVSEATFLEMILRSRAYLRIWDLYDAVLKTCILQFLLANVIRWSSPFLKWYPPSQSHEYLRIQEFFPLLSWQIPYPRLPWQSPASSLILLTYSFKSAPRRRFSSSEIVFM